MVICTQHYTSKESEFIIELLRANKTSARSSTNQHVVMDDG